MSAPTFEDLTKWINVFDSTLNVARNYDSVEVAITFANPRFKEFIGLELIRSFVQADANQTWLRAVSARDRLVQTYRWLAQSRQSVAALNQASEAWKTAHTQAKETYAEMDAIRRKDTHWDGAGSAGQSISSAAQMRAQEQLVDVTAQVMSGCTQAATVMRKVFTDANIVLASNALIAIAFGMRAPVVLGGLFGFNTRMRAVASALEGAAQKMEAIEAGDGWKPQSLGLAAFFSQNSGAIAAMTAQSRRNIPV